MKARWIGLSIVAVIIALMVAGLRILNRPQLTLEDFPLVSCSNPNSQAATRAGRVFHVDLHRGSAEGDGSAGRPWRNLQPLVDAGLIGEMRRELWLSDRVIAALANTVPVVSSRERKTAVVRTGDTVVLASGDYSALNLAGLANRGFVTIVAAPGAKVRFPSIDLSGASHFVLRGITVQGARLSRGPHLVSTYAPGPLRADNIVLDDMEISSDLPIATARPDAFADLAPDGVILSGDCLQMMGSRLHDLESAVNIFRGRKVTVANNVIRDFSVDGVQFSGRDIFVRDNAIFDQWPTPDPLHPDCMQGQPPDDQTFGPVMISGNLCVRAFASTLRDQLDAKSLPDHFGWQGIVTFDGRWREVTIRCNLVLPDAQHGIALYGMDGALIEHNVVVGLSRGEPKWIAAMPSTDGRQPVGVVIKGNRATAYLNAVQYGPKPLEDMIDIVRVRRHDPVLMATLRRPISGVTLIDNVLLIAPDSRQMAIPDKRFGQESIASPVRPRDMREARELYALPEECSKAA